LRFNLHVAPKLVAISAVKEIHVSNPQDCDTENQHEKKTHRRDSMRQAVRSRFKSRNRQCHRIWRGSTGAVRINPFAQSLSIAASKRKDSHAMTSRAAFHQDRTTANPLASAPAGSFLAVVGEENGLAL